MTIPSADEIRGFEYDWLASDANGHIALFSTAGGGYVPSEFLSNIKAHEKAIDEILTSPFLTSSKFAPTLESGIINTWQLMAERGIFAFDSDPTGGPYQMVAAPQRPIRVPNLIKIVSKVTTLLTFSNLHFSKMKKITEDDLNPTRL